MTAIPPFISTDPLPPIKSSLSNSYCWLGTMGTVSTWPTKAIFLLDLLGTATIPPLFLLISP